MRHIALRAYGAPPCHGEVVRVPRPAPPATSPTARPGGARSLPVLGQPAAPPPEDLWRCTRCGQTWEREPLPDEAL